MCVCGKGLQLQDVAHFIAVAETCVRFPTVQEKNMHSSVFPSARLGSYWFLKCVLVHAGKLMSTNVTAGLEKTVLRTFLLRFISFFFLFF